MIVGKLAALAIADPEPPNTDTGPGQYSRPPSDTAALLNAVGELAS